MLTLRRTMQKLFWVYRTKNFVISSPSEVPALAAAVPCALVPITIDNHARVEEFREPLRVAEYGRKVRSRELGCFIESNGRVIASIWATVNNTPATRVVRMYMPLLPGEALIHDIVTGEAFRGKGVGPYMVSAFAARLFRELPLSRIVIDVNDRNRPSLRMMQKLGVPMRDRVLYISALGTLLGHFRLNPATPVEG